MAPISSHLSSHVAWFISQTLVILHVIVVKPGNQPAESRPLCTRNKTTRFCKTAKGPFRSERSKSRAMPFKWFIYEPTNRYVTGCSVSERCSPGRRQANQCFTALMIKQSELIDVRSALSSSILTQSATSPRYLPHATSPCLL